MPLGQLPKHRPGDIRVLPMDRPGATAPAHQSSVSLSTHHSLEGQESPRAPDRERWSREEGRQHRARRGRARAWVGGPGGARVLCWERSGGRLLLPGWVDRGGGGWRGREMGPVPELRRDKAEGPTGGTPLHLAAVSGGRGLHRGLPRVRGVCPSPVFPQTPPNHTLVQALGLAWAPVPWPRGVLGPSEPRCALPWSRTVPPLVSGSREKYVRTRPWHRASCPSDHGPCSCHWHGGRGRSGPRGAIFGRCR